MSDTKKFQQKANALFEQYPEVSKVFISENGQCFFDEKAAKDYHHLRDFDLDPEIFFRDGIQDEDDSDLQEALHKTELKLKIMTATFEDIAAVCDLEHDYEPADADTDETVTAVITLREKYAEKDRLLSEAHIELEKFSNAEEENENLKKELEALNKQIEEANKTNITKTRKNAAQTDRAET